MKKIQKMDLAMENGIWVESEIDKNGGREVKFEFSPFWVIKYGDWEIVLEHLLILIEWTMYF